MKVAHGERRDPSINLSALLSFTTTHSSVVKNGAPSLSQEASLYALNVRNPSCSVRIGLDAYEGKKSRAEGDYGTCGEKITHKWTNLKQSLARATDRRPSFPDTCVERDGVLQGSRARERTLPPSHYMYNVSAMAHRMGFASVGSSLP